MLHLLAINFVEFMQPILSNFNVPSVTYQLCRTHANKHTKKILKYTR